MKLPHKRYIDKIENDTRPLVTGMFEDITLNDRESFTWLLDKLKKYLQKKSIEYLDALIPEYWNNESALQNVWINPVIRGTRRLGNGVRLTTSGVKLTTSKMVKT